MAGLYLLFGEEDYLKKQKKEKLIAELLPPGDTMNLSCFEGRDISIREMIDISETMPFFADVRVILVENSGLFKEKGEELAEYLTEVPESTAFIFVEHEIDKRCKLYKLLQKNGTVEEVKTPEDGTLVKWIGKRASERGLKIRESTAQYLVDKCGRDMYTLNNEMDKLFGYCNGLEVIETSYIDDICTEMVQNEIFKMLEDITNNNGSMALKRYYDLIALREPPMRILALITRQFRIMYIVKSLYSDRVSNNDIAKAAGIPPFSVKKYLGGRNFSIDRIREAMEECANLDEAIKTGNINEQMSVELLITKYSTLQNQ